MSHDLGCFFIHADKELSSCLKVTTYYIKGLLHFTNTLTGSLLRFPSYDTVLQIQVGHLAESCIASALSSQVCRCVKPKDSLHGKIVFVLDTPLQCKSDCKIRVLITRVCRDHYQTA